MSRTVAWLIGVLLLGPSMVLLGVAVFFNPAADASCLPSARTASVVPVEGPTESPRIMFPLPADTWVRTSGFGSRVHPITGVRTLHTGLDLAAPSGTPILAVADGRIVFAGPAAGYGNLVLIEHTIDTRTVVSGYAHMDTVGILVAVGDLVPAGHPVARVGNSGYSTNPHLHFEIRPGGGPAVDPEPWLAAHDAATTTAGIDGAATAAGCPPPPTPLPLGAAASPGQIVDDPTSDGQITQPTAYILSQVRGRFPHSSWSCWSERPGSGSEHEIGRACDGTFGNAIGTAASGSALELGWLVISWLQNHATALGVEYLIWQGRIWSVARAAEGWRPYDGGGMHDPSSVTGGHYDHVHFTAS